MMTEEATATEVEASAPEASAPASEPKAKRKKPKVTEDAPPAPPPPIDTTPLAIRYIPIADIDESKFNPRKTFAALDELAEDLKLHGVMQPVLVRPVASFEAAQAKAK